MAFSNLEEFSRMGLPRDVFASDEVFAVECLETSYEDMLEAFRAADIDTPIPQSSVSRRMKEIECWMAAYRFMFDKFDPTNEADKKIEQRWTWAREWLDKVALKQISPLPLTPVGDPIDATPDTDESGAGIVSDVSRNWAALGP